jgi:hypothetical protein
VVPVSAMTSRAAVAAAPRAGLDLWPDMRLHPAESLLLTA